MDFGHQEDCAGSQTFDDTDLMSTLIVVVDMLIDNAKCDFQP